LQERKIETKSTKVVSTDLAEIAFRQRLEDVAFALGTTLKRAPKILKEGCAGVKPEAR
jgi:hypothetical protein